jgi:hypothetical protein
MEFSFLQVKIDSIFWQGLSHHLKEKLSTFLKVTLLLLVHRDLDGFIQKGFETFEMVWMRMGQDDEINLFRRNPIPFHLMKKMGNMTGMTRINEDRHLSVDNVRVTIVLMGILPQIGVEVFPKLHMIDLLFISPNR